MKSLRLRLAIALARLASLLSRQIFRKSGETISGRILLAVYPKGIEVLAKGKSVALISGTNGKTSTTSFFAKIMENLAPVTSNVSGSNLNWGVASALMSDKHFAILEVDELHLISVIQSTKPDVVLLLNLSRDQLHRMHEVKRVADRWHASFSNQDKTTFVIDVDDPFLEYATLEVSRVIKVSFGGRLHLDGAACPSCGKYLIWTLGNYECSCGLSNKNADRIFKNGSASYRNSVLANVAAEIMGANPIEIDEQSLERSVTKEINGSVTTIRLTKNPASWIEALRGVHSNDVILILNAREADGFDTSWLWDVSYASLKEKNVVVCGERGIDLSYRLHVEGIENKLVQSFEEAMSFFPPGSHVTVLAAYTAFFELASK